LFTNWPLGLAFIITGMVSWPRLKSESDFGHNPDLMDAFSLWIGMAVFFVVSLYSQSSTTNLNSGASPGVSRYALWYIALIYPFALATFTWASRSRVSMVAVSCVTVIAAGATFGGNAPTREENSGRPNSFSTFVQTNVPWAYSPPPEVFLERFSRRGEATAGIAALVGPDCKKTLLTPDTSPVADVVVPASCDFRAFQISNWVDVERDAQARYRNLTSADIAPLPTLAFGQRAYFGEGSDFATASLTDGWSVPEPWGVWSLGPNAAVDIPLSNIPATTDGTVLIELQGFVLPSSPSRKIEIRANGGPPISTVIDLLAPTRIISVPVTGAALRSTGLLSLEFAISNPISPKEAGLSDDGRALGIGLVSITVNSDR
jgi:hypothetical protein